MKVKKTTSPKMTELPKLLGREKIKIGMGKVPYSEGVPIEQLMKRLTEAAKKNLFPLTAFPANE